MYINGEKHGEITNWGYRKKNIPNSLTVNFNFITFASNEIKLGKKYKSNRYSGLKMGSIVVVNFPFAISS